MVREVWLNRIALFGLAGIVFGFFSTNNKIDHDMLHEMALFRETLVTGRIPTEDTFSYVPTVNPIIHHEWGTGALLYLITVSSGLGATGLMITKYLLLAAIAIGCYIHARRQGASIAVFTSIALVGVMLLSVTLGTNIRAKFFSLLFVTILMLFLQEDQRGKRWWIAIWLPLQVVWINLHAGFMIGLGLIGFYTLERFVEALVNRRTLSVAFREIGHLAGVILFMILLVPINPYGFDYVPYLWRALLLDRSPLVTEWQPIWNPTLGKGRFLVIFLFLLSIIITAYAAFKRRFHNMPHVLFLLMAAWLSAWHARFLSIFSLLWICCTPAYLENTKFAEILNNIWKKKRCFLLVLWIVYGTLGVRIAILRHFWLLRIPTTLEEYEKEGARIFPVGAVDYLASQDFKGNVMVSFNTGSYVSWKLYPAVKVSCDSRYEAAYPEEWAMEQTRFYQAKEGWQETLNRYPTDAVLVPRYSPIHELLEQPATNMETITAQWCRVYKDDGFSVFVRSEIADQFDVVDNTGKPIIASFP